MSQGRTRRVERVIGALLKVNIDSAFAAFYLTLYWCDDASAILERLASDHPTIVDHELFGEVASMVDEFGSVPMN